MHLPEAFAVGILMKPSGRPLSTSQRSAEREVCIEVDLRKEMKSLTMAETAIEQPQSGLNVSSPR